MKYKIEKQISRYSGKEIYRIYKSMFWGLYWGDVGLEMTLDDARKRVTSLKEKDDWSRKSKKKEIVEYW